MIEIRSADHHTWLGEPGRHPSLGLIRGLVLLACLVLWIVGIAAAMVLLTSCSVHWEALDGGAEPRMEAEP